MAPINFFKKLTAIILSFLTSVGVFAGDSMNNGGGLAEQNFLLVYAQLPEIYEACIHSTECRLSAAEKELIRIVQKNYPMELQTSDQIQFSENQPRAFVTPDGQILVARTEPRVGAQILVNRDVVYKNNSTNETIHFSEAEAAGTLTDQFLIHQNLSNRNQRRYIALIIQNFYQQTFAR